MHQSIDCPPLPKNIRNSKIENQTQNIDDSLFIIKITRNLHVSNKGIDLLFK
jgi:hypothetical protein